MATFASTHWVQPGGEADDPALIDGLVHLAKERARSQGFSVIDEPPWIRWLEPTVLMRPSSDAEMFDAGWKYCRIELNVVRPSPG